MAQYIIPTIFTAVNQMSRPIVAMNNSLNGLRTNANSVFSETTKQMTSFAKSAAVAGAIIGGGAFTVKTLMEYEKELSNLKALTGTSGKEFQNFKSIIQSVAEQTKTSSVDVAKSFTTIANAMPELLKSADGLGMVTSASIILAKAARMELEPAAASVTTILNQFGKGAKDAGTLVDMMAAGSKYGSAEISDLSASITEFGAQARLAGVSLRESIAVTELVSKFRKGTQAGIELRNVLIEMGKGSAQDPLAIADMKRLGVNIGIVSNKAIPLSDRLIELKKIAGDSNALFHVFGKENQAMAATVLANAEALKPLVQQVGEVGNAQRMANENTNNFAGALTRLGDAWARQVTGSQGASAAMTTVAKVINFIGNNLGPITNTVLVLAELRATIWLISKAYALWKVRVVAFNYAQGITNALMGKFPTLLFASQEGMLGMAHGAAIAQASLWQILGVVALVGTAVGLLVAQFSSADDEMDNVNVKIDQTGKKFHEIKKPINEATAALNAYNKEVDTYNAKQNARTLAALKEQKETKGFGAFSRLFYDVLHGKQMVSGSATGAYAKPDILSVPVRPKIDSNQIQTEYLQNYTAPATVDSANTQHSTAMSYNEQKNTVEVVVTAAQGTEAKVVKNDSKIPIKMSRTNAFV